MKKLVTLLLFFLTACGTSRDQRQSDLTPKEPSYTSQREHPPKRIIVIKRPRPKLNYRAIQNQLGMKRPKNQLGLRESKFNVCDVVKDNEGLECENLYFGVLHAQILCRATDGTTESMSHNELRPVARKNIHWTLGDTSGKLQTDAQGFGSFLSVYKDSQKGNSISLKKGKYALRLGTGNFKRKIVVPKYWCR